MPELKCIPQLPLVFPNPRGMRGETGGGEVVKTKGKEINARVDSVHIHLLMRKKITAVRL